MPWDYYNKNPHLEEINLLGLELSNHIHCAVRFPAHEKNLFECHCTNLDHEGIIFPVFIVKAALESGDWSHIDEMHRTGGR